MVILEEIKIGVEVETTLLTRREVAEAIRTVVGGTVEHIGTPSCYDPYRITDARGLVWNVVADSSLTSAPPEKRAEIVSPILGYDDIPQLQEIIRAVRRAGARAGADAGLHVHVSSEHVTPKALANLCKMVYKQEEIIYAALGVSDVRKARYCKPLNPEFIRRICANPPRTFKQLNTQWYGRYAEHPQRYDQSRYYVAPRIMWRHRPSRSQPRRFVPHNIQPHSAAPHPLFTSTPPFTLVLSRKSSLSRPGTGLSSAFE